MNKPARLYKYEAITTQTLDNIKTQVIYFGSPKNFNDPYDCALSPMIKKLTEGEIELIRGSYLKDLLIGDNRLAELNNLNTVKLGKMLQGVGENVIKEQMSKVYLEKGVSCFSEKNDNLLMWSHYAGNGKGICLEFDTAFEPFSKVRCMKYKSEMPLINLTPMLCDKDYEQVLDLFHTKSVDWQYEKEWRVLHKDVGTKFCFESKALTGVYFGPDINPSILEIICLILKGQNEHVKFWRGTRSTKTFTVEFAPFTYTSNIDARKAGLLPD